MCKQSMDYSDSVSSKCNHEVTYLVGKDSKGAFNLGKLTTIICREIIAQLDIAHENRELSAEETQLKRLLKNRILGLSPIERSRARQ
jgi:hypothetical protein